MRWFKHDSDAGNDAKLRKLRLKYGATGYGIYWYCLELIARNVDKHNLTFELEHDAVLIADDFKLSGELVQEMMAFMVDLGLFENTQGVITCLKMSTRTDEYTQKLLVKNKSNDDYKDGFYIYFISYKGADSVKIGVSKNPWSRLKEFQTGHQEELEVLATVKTFHQGEKHIADLLISKHKRGEWYILDHEMKIIIDRAKSKETVTCSDLADVINSVVGTKSLLSLTKSELIEEKRREEKINTLVSNKVADECPHQEIIKLYHEHLPMLTQVKIWNAKRQTLLKTRWKESKERQNLDYWKRLFQYIAKSDFLTGKASKWQADLEWIVNSSNFTKIIEGKYENKEVNNG